MTSIDIDCLLTTIAKAVDDARGSLSRHTTGRADLLNSFWFLQDNMSCLVQAVADHRDQTLLRLMLQHPHLPHTIADFVQDVSSSWAYRIAAVASSCRSIDDSLKTIDRLQARADAPVVMQSAMLG